MGFDYSRYFGEISLIQDLTTLPGDRTWRQAPPPRDGERHEIVLYLGCNVLRTSHMIRTALAIFDRLGLDYVAVGGPTYCCGIVHQNHGDSAAGAGKARHVVELFTRLRPAEVVMWCPSCIYYFDEVQQLTLPFRVRQTAEFLADRLGDLHFTQAVDARVAFHYHDAFPPRRREGLAGRRLLEALPGLRIVDLALDPRYGRSCSTGVRDQLGLASWNAMVRGHIDRALAAGATTMATMYHGCHRLMCGFEAERPLVFEHYISLVGRGLGIEFEDTYKKYRLWADPDRVLADMTPCQDASGVDPAKARALVERAFPGPAGGAPMDVAPPG